MLSEEQLPVVKKEIRTAAYAGAFSALITAAYAIAGEMSESFHAKNDTDAWNFIDVVLIGSLAFGIYKQNRYCAAGLLIYYAFNALYEIYTFENVSNALGSLFFLFFFVKGTIAAFRLHNHLIETGEKVKKKRGIGFYFLTGSAAFLFACIMLLMVIGMMGPGTEVVPGRQLQSKYHKFIDEKGWIDYSEEIEYWYSDALIDFKNGFYFFTKDKVVLYSEEWSNPEILIPLKTISNISLEPDTEYYTDSKIILLYDEGQTVNFPVSTDNGGDQKFFARLQEVWQKHKHAVESGLSSE